MSGHEFRYRLLLFLLVLILGLLTSCDWLLEAPLPRTNPSDENAVVYYFRAIPQRNGGAMDRTRLKWNWSAEDPHNPGRVTIMRKSTGYPRSIGDSTAVQVYRSQTDDVEVLNIFTTPPVDQTGEIYYYTLFCEIDGFENIIRFNSPPTDFTNNTGVDLDTIFTASFSFNGSSYNGSLWEYSATLPTPPLLPVAISSGPPVFESYAIFVPNVFTLPSLAVDIYAADFSYTAGNAGTLEFNRMIGDAGDDKGDQYYFSVLKNSGLWTTENQVVHVPTTGGSYSVTGFDAMLEDWLDTLLFYGIRVSTLPGESNTVLPDRITIDYVGPPP